MAPTTRLTRRQIFILAGTAIFFVGLVIWALLVSFGQLKEAVISKAFASNIDYSKQMDEKTIYFFSGSAFAAYDLSTQTTKPLTQFFALPTQTQNVAWSKRAALYQTSTYTLSDQLYATLIQNNLNPFGSYWWLFDFTSGKPTLVGTPGNQASVRDVIWQDDDTYLFSETVKGGQGVRIMRADIGGQPVEVANINSISRLLSANSETITYLVSVPGKASGSYFVTNRSIKSGQDSKPLGDSTFEDVLAIGSDGSMLLIADDKNEAAYQDEIDERAQGPLMYYNSKTNTTTKVEDSFSGTAAWRYDNDQWLAVGVDANNQPISAGNDGDRITRYKTPIAEGEDYYAVGRTAQGQILKDRFEKLYYASDKKIDNLKEAPDSSILSNNIYASEFTMAYDSDFRQYKFYITTPSNKVGLDAAVKFIQSKGLDPYQIRTRWYGSNSPDF